MKNGQQVKAGTLLVQLDTTDAQNAIRDAEISLQQEQLALEKMQGITTVDGTIRGTKEKATDDMTKAYEDGFNTVANIFLQLPDMMSGLNGMLFNYDFDASQQNVDYYANAVRTYDDQKVTQYEKDVNSKYAIARVVYEIIGMDVIEKTPAKKYFLIVMENGYGKRTDVSEILKISDIFGGVKKAFHISANEPSTSNDSAMSNNVRR